MSESERAIHHHPATGVARCRAPSINLLTYPRLEPEGLICRCEVVMLFLEWEPFQRKAQGTQ